MYFMLKDAPVVAVQQTETQDAPGVESSPPFSGGKACRLHGDVLVGINTGDYVVVLPNDEKRVIPALAFEALFKVV